MSLPPLRLIERRCHSCRLAGDEVRHLLAHHRHHLELTPTTRGPYWQVRPRGVAGMLTTPRRLVVIEPKMPLDTVAWLIGGVLAGEAASAAGPLPAGGGFLDLLAALLARRMLERAATGLHHGYREETTRGPYLLGRLDLAAQLRRPGTAEGLTCRHDRFTASLPCNQLPRAVANALAALPLLPPSLRQALERAADTFAPAGEALLTPVLLAQVRTEAAPPDYRALLELALLLADGLQPGLDAGNTPGPALLVSLERLFEGHVSRLVESSFAGRSGWRVCVQATTQAITDADGPGLALRPDLSVARHGRTALVIDAKWKRPGDTVPAEDARQVLGYAAALGATEAMLVYAGRGQYRGDYAFTDCPIRLRVRTLAVTGTLPRRAAAVRRLQQECRRLAAAALRRR